MNKKRRGEETQSARDELRDKLVTWRLEVLQIIQQHLPDDVRTRYAKLRAEIVDLEGYLREHNDEYIEKDRAFDRSRCPIAVVIENGKGGLLLNKKTFSESKAFRLCMIQDCPDYPECWAVHSTELPVTRELGKFSDSGEPPERTPFFEKDEK